MPRESRYQRLFTGSPSFEVPVVTAADWQRWKDEMEVPAAPLYRALASCARAEDGQAEAKAGARGSGDGEAGGRGRRGGRWAMDGWGRGLSATSVQDVFDVGLRGERQVAS